MKFSLLFVAPTGEELFDFNSNDKSNLTYDLSIDRAINRVCHDNRRTEYFLNVIRHPLKKIDDIIYRQQIFGDFIENPDLFDELKLIFTRYDKIKNDWIELRSNAYPSGGGTSNNAEALLDYTFSSLKVTAIFPRTIISFYESIYTALNNYKIKSGGLCAVRDYCFEMGNNNSLNEIANISSLFQYHTPEDYDFDILCGFDETLQLISCDLCKISERKKKKKLFDFKKPIEDTPTEIGTDREAFDSARFILTEALYHIDAALTAVTNHIYNTFFGISRELMFYETSIKCFEYISELGVPLCIPSIRAPEDDIFEVRCLRDLFTITEKHSCKAVMPNDVSFNKDDGGLLIRGMNNTGKTTYLRSIGTAQLFAQAGLPVCAKSAEISIRNAVFTHFSAAEEDFIVGDTSGRFEGEVRDIANILNAIQPYSLVLLNETFQTTSYSEGALGIYNIITILSKINSKFIFVTHLLKLFDMCAGSGIKMLETTFSENDAELRYKLHVI